MIGQLQRLLAVREARLHSLQAALARKLTALAAVDEELEEVNRELAQIAQHRATWESEWHHWLHEDRVVCHGQDYNLSHLALSAWEQDAQQLQAEVLARREAAAEELGSARLLVLRAQQRLAALGDELHEARRRRTARHAALLDDRVHDEIVSRARIVQASAGLAR